MYDILADSIIEATIQGDILGQVVLTTFHYRNVSPITDGREALVDFLAGFEVAVWDKIRLGLSQDLDPVFLTMQWIHPTRYRKVTREPAQPKGFVATAAAPTGVAVVTRRFADEAGRKYQGRIYSPGIAIADVLESRVTDTWYVVNEQNYRDAVLAGLTDPVWGVINPGLFNDFPAPHFNEVSGAFVDKILRYQRRRELQVGV